MHSNTTRPAVTINKATDQADPTLAGPINFTVDFGEPVAGFVDGDLSLSGEQRASIRAGRTRGNSS